MSQGRRATILVVEDEPALRRIALRILGAAGYDVLLADRAEDALSRIALGQPIDLVICDLNLPDMNGLTFYQRLRGQGFPGRFLLVSGSEREDVVRQHTLPLGVPFLQKPWTIQALANAVRELLGD
jgi:CheY-like chemotaxis protein